MKKFADSSEEYAGYTDNDDLNYITDKNGLRRRRAARNNVALVAAEEATRRAFDSATARQLAARNAAMQSMSNASMMGARAARDLQQYSNSNPGGDSWGNAFSAPVSTPVVEEEEEKPAPKPKKQKAPPVNEFI